MSILYFDTETTGLIRNGLNYRDHYMMYPRIVQLSWYFDGVMNDFIIKPDGYVIPYESEMIHGISTDEAIEKGVEFDSVIRMFLSDCGKANHLVGHNIYFDVSVVKSNVLMLNDSDLSLFCDIVLAKRKRIDTMLSSIRYVNARNSSNHIKFPSLEELHLKLFGCGYFDAHNSCEDVKSTMKCFARLNELGIIKTQIT